MKLFIITLLSSLLLVPASLHAADIDRSSPQSTYDSCYANVSFDTAPDDVYEKIDTCLTHTAQKGLVSYAVLGAQFIDSLKNRRGEKKHPDFLNQVNDVLKAHELLGASRLAFQQADLARTLTDILSIYAATPTVREKVEYSARSLKKLESAENSAQGLEVFKLNTPLPANTLALSFVKINDQWLINYISHRRP